jgi:hypothetical protein
MAFVMAILGEVFGSCRDALMQMKNKGIWLCFGLKR